MKKSKPRIGIITHNYPIDSKERKDAGIFIFDFAQELAKYCDVFILCPDFGGKKEKHKKVPVTWFKWDTKNEKFGNWQLFNPIYIFKFFKLIFIGQKEAIKFAQENNLDFCLACWAIPSAILAFRINQVLKIPYACWSLGSDVNKYTKIPILRQFIYFSFRKSQKLFANSYALIDQVQKLANKNCYFLPAITDFNLKTKSTKPKDKKFHFVYVGRLEKVKGVDILVDAVKEATKTRKDFIVDVLGNGTMFDHLKQKTIDSSLTNIVFHGWADEKTVSNFMSSSDCLVIPSRSESMPLVMIEAAKRNLPVIATDVGDCKRVITKYKIGISVQKEDPQSLGQAMIKILENKTLYKKTPGFKKLSQDFSQEKAVSIFMKSLQV